MGDGLNRASHPPVVGGRGPTNTFTKTVFTMEPTVEVGKLAIGLEGFIIECTEKGDAGWDGDTLFTFNRSDMDEMLREAGVEVNGSMRRRFLNGIHKWAEGKSESKLKYPLRSNKNRDKYLLWSRVNDKAIVGTKDDVIYI